MRIPGRRIIIQLGLILSIVVAVFSCEEDPCQDVECGPNGVCFEGICLCDIGYEGDQCDIISRAELLGTYTALKDCGIGIIDTFEVQILEGAGDLSTFIVKDVDEYNCPMEQIFDLQGEAIGNHELVFGFTGDCETNFEGTGTSFTNMNTGAQTVSINMTINYFDQVDSVNVVESCVWTLRR